MPKSGRGRGKSFKKAKVRRSVPVARTEQQTAAMPQQTVTPLTGPAAFVKRPAAVAPSVRAKTTAAPMAAVYPYIHGEIKKICILSAILIVILVILAVTWP